MTEKLHLAEQADKLAVDAALDEVEKTRSGKLAWEVTSDKTAEVSIQGEKGRLSGAAYGKIVWGATKDYVAGVRGAWAFRKK